MSKEVKNKISILKKCQEKTNPIIDSNDSETVERLRGLRDDGLIELTPAQSINSSAAVRLTDKGEEHLQKLIESSTRNKIIWLGLSVITAGVVTYIVRLNS